MAPSKFMLHTYSLWEVNFFDRKCNGTYFLKSLERYWWCFHFQDLPFPILCLLYVTLFALIVGVVSVLTSKAILNLFEMIWKTTYLIKRNDQTTWCASSNISCANVCWHVLPKKLSHNLNSKTEWLRKVEDQCFIMHILSTFRAGHTRNVIEQQPGWFSPSLYVQKWFDPRDCLVVDLRRHVSASFKPWEPTSSSPRVQMKNPC